MSQRGATLLVVGDIHGHWRDADRDYLECNGQDVVLFVGDLGDEDVELTRAIAALRCEKSVILGNHDAWQSFTEKQPTAKLTEILRLLGDAHLAYGVRELPQAGFSIVGARPFTWGGRSLRSPELYAALYGITTVEESTARIVAAARRTRHDDLLILAHNGPHGLSSRPADIWGKDFGQPGGDWGDRDLEVALDGIKALGKRVRCVVAGHMHDRLMHPRGSLRTRFVDRGGTLFVNTAVVPRVQQLGDGREVGHFLRLELENGEVRSFSDLWA
jgi:uncharacterized protein (TIGR04168 family)